jgi:hypothetical protein
MSRSYTSSSPQAPPWRVAGLKNIYLLITLKKINSPRITFRHAVGQFDSGSQFISFSLFLHCCVLLGRSLVFG